MMSILTNTSAMTSLQNLTATQRQLSKTQGQISSGLAIANASDNAAYWSIAQTMSAQVAGLSAVKQGLSITNSIANVTAAALVSIKTSLDKMQADIVTAGQSGASQSAVQSDIVAQQQSILAVANSASFNGINWLIDHISSSTTTNIVGTSSVSKENLQSIALGLGSSGAQSVYSSITTITNTLTNGGSTASVIDISHEIVTKTDNDDGTVTFSPPVIDQAHSSSGVADVGRVVVPTSVSSTSGLLSTSFSLAPLTLFSDNAGTSAISGSVTYGGVTPETDPIPSMGTSNSYAGYGSSFSTGILDGAITVTIAVPAGASSSGGQSSSSIYIFDPTTGGNVLQTSPSSSSGGSATTETIQENILTLSVVGASADDLATMGKEVQAAIGGIIGASTAVGSLQTQISNQQSYNSALSDALTSGIGSLVDVDMNVASTRLQALQTQQQLGIQALSIANQNSQLVLKLFQAA